MRESGYPLHVMHDYRIPVGDLDEFLKPLARGSLDASRRSSSVVSKQRQTLLPFGAIVLAELLRAGKPRSMSVSALGLREGLLFSKLDPATQERGCRFCPRLASSAILRSRSPAHAEELIAWTAAAMRALGIDETEEEARLRAASCLLADIGWRAHPDYRGEQSFNIIAHAAFVGVDHPGRAYPGAGRSITGTPACPTRNSGSACASSRRSATASVRARLAATFRVAYLVSGCDGGGSAAHNAAASGRMRWSWYSPRDLADLAGDRLATPAEAARRARRAVSLDCRRRLIYSAATLVPLVERRRGLPRAATGPVASSPRFSASACSPKS